MMSSVRIPIPPEYADGVAENLARLEQMARLVLDRFETIDEADENGDAPRPFKA